ncbi:MAG: hypothetical protein AADX96_05215 [Thiocapsa sp. C3-sup]|uniref:hypothetical protein n=1 Tax=Thiocapsa sp. C2-2m TaxID=3137395 RepID=UPI0035B1612D
MRINPATSLIGAAGRSAAQSTSAGNLTLIGAASNIIIVQAAERRGAHLGFWVFFAVGAPLTLLNLAVYWAWLGMILIGRGLLGGRLGNFRKIRST